MVLAQWKGALAEDFTPLQSRVADVLQKIKGPLLSIHGKDEGEEYAVWLRGFVPQAEVEYWPGTGHWLHLVDPDRFCGRVLAFDPSSSPRN